MFEELRKRSIKKVLPAVIILCLAGIVVLGFSAKGFFKVLGGNKAFEKLKPDEIKEGMYVKAEIYGNLGIALEKTERREGSSYEKPVASYHVIWTGEEEDEDYRFMLLKLPVKYDSEMEDMFYDYYMGNETKTLTFTGRIEKAEKLEEKYFYEYMQEDWGMTDDDIEDFTMPYIIAVEGATGNKIGACVFFLAGVGLLLWGILFMVATVNGGRLKKLRKEIAEIGYSDERVEADYARKRELCAAPKLYVGAELLFFNEGAVAHVLRQRDIIWVYYSATAQRVNGIKVATTYTLQIVLKNGKIYPLGVATKEKAVQAVETFGKAFPWVVVGYTDELAALHRNNLEAFLDLAYNNAQTDDPYAQVAATVEDPAYETPIR